MERRRITTSALVVAAVLAASGCMRERELPPLHAEHTAGEETREPSAAGDPVREDLRELHARCTERRNVLRAELERAKERQRRVTAAAAAAWIVGEAADGHDGVKLPVDTAPGCPRSNEPGDAAGVSTICGPGSVVMLHGEHPASPTVQRTVDTHLDARQAIRAINKASDAADEFLFSHPDSTEWSEAQWQRWKELRGDLERACSAPEPAQGEEPALGRGDEDEPEEPAPGGP